MTKYLIISLFIFTQKAICQQVNVSIQKVTISDSTIAKTIKQIIDTESDSSSQSPFNRKFGYISLTINSSSNSAYIADYYIEPSLYIIKKNDLDNKFPFFYSYMYGKIVLIYYAADLIPFDYHISKKNKQKLIHKLDPYLMKPHKEVFHDMNGKKVFTDKNFRLEFFKFDAGKHVIMLKNKTTKLCND